MSQNKEIMDIVDDNTIYGKCRCCLTLGNHRDLMREYDFNGTQEIYYKIFLECFNVLLHSNTTEGNLICDSCILRLKDASSFKKMVQEAEWNLMNCDIPQEDSASGQIHRLEVPIEIKIEPPDLKFESVEMSQHEDDTDEDLPHEDKEDPLWKPQDNRVGIKIENFIDNTMCSDDDQFNYSSDGEKSAKSSHKARKKTCKSQSRQEKLGYIHNTTIILENSNVTPFKSKKNGYTCFYCPIKFENLTDVRVHQKEHTKTDLKKLLHSYQPEDFLVYVDVTDLKCTICDQSLPNLNALKTHLNEEHKKTMRDFPDRIVAFKITDTFQCQICDCIYEDFLSLETHMESHYVSYACNECGEVFKCLSLLKTHSKQHSGGHACDICNNQFNTPKQLKNHYRTAHKGAKRFNCEKCDESYAEYYRLQKHVLEKHAITLGFRCSICDKTFDKKYTLSTHKMKEHLGKKYRCNQCPYSCYTNNDLKGHMIKHNGERIFECSICNKSYARKKTLREHMRIHNNDRRYACEVCGLAFVQNCNLKGHIKSQHPFHNVK